MAKIVVSNLQSSTKRKGKPASITEKRVRDEFGEMHTIRMLDPNSPTFTDDLRYVFAKNVAKARKRNKSLIGSPDVVLNKR